MDNPIVFIHGSGDNARIWRLQVEYFDTGRVFAVDLPGHGQRPDTLASDASVMDYTQAIHEIIQHELQLQRPVIAGHSLGGAIALMLGIEYGSELGGLILIGTGARLRVLPALLEGAEKAPQQTRLQLLLIGVTQAHAETVPQMIARELGDPGPHILYRDLAACNVYDIMPRLNDIHLPTLIICGADDRLTPVKYSQYLHERIPGSTLRIIHNAGHYVMREQPDAVNQAIEEWLRQQ